MLRSGSRGRQPRPAGLGRSVPRPVPRACQPVQGDAGVPPGTAGSVDSRTPESGPPATGRRRGAWGTTDAVGRTAARPRPSGCGSGGQSRRGTGTAHPPARPPRRGRRRREVAPQVVFAEERLGHAEDFLIGERPVYQPPDEEPSLGPFEPVEEVRYGDFRGHPRVAVDTLAGVPRTTLKPSARPICSSHRRTPGGDQGEGRAASVHGPKERSDLGVGGDVGQLGHRLLELGEQSVVGGVSFFRVRRRGGKGTALVAECPDAGQ